MLIQTSQDLFFVVLSFCVLWFTVFLCWMLYYVIMILKRSKETMDVVYKTINSVQEKIEKVGKVIDMVKDKLENTGSALGLLFNNIIKIIGMVEKKKAEKKKKN